MNPTPKSSHGKPSHASDAELVKTTGAAVRRSTFGPGSMGMPVERSANFWVVMRRLGEVLGKQTRKLWLVAILTVGSVTCVVLGPRLLGYATDTIVRGIIPGGTGGIDFGALRKDLMIAGGLYLIAWLLGLTQGFIIAGMVQTSVFNLRNRVEAKLNRLPLSYVDAQSRGDLLSRVTNDIDNFAQSLQQTTNQIITSILTLVGVAIMMFWISPIMAVVALVTTPLALYFIKVIGGKARPRFIAQWRYTGAVNAQAEETFTGHAIVKSFGRSHEVEERFNADNDELFKASFSAQFLASSIGPVIIFMGNLQYVLIAVVGGLRIASGSLSVGELQAMIQYGRQFSQPLGMLANMAATFQSGMASLERVLELLDAEEMTPDPAPIAMALPVQGRVTFDDVTFSYSPDTELIQNLNVIAEPGQTVAIVGPTGAGKTTLVNLLMRFYELDGGAITLDGHDTVLMPRGQLRENFGMVLQDAWLFHGTIRDNLMYGNPDATEQQMLEAAQVTFVDRFVHSLPDGYDTVISEEADNISVGEKQLLTIARAFLADPAILILDEATSSVDTRTEVLIQNAMNNLRANRTSFVIAHRLSTIRGADMILVMDGGRIVEQGNHDELIAANGAYSQLYQAQFEGQDT